MPMAAGAAGLGKLTVLSGLGQPLNAEIDLLSTSEDELSSLSARIAPVEVFAEQGVERASTMAAIAVELGRRPDGAPIIRLKTAQPVNDPFLDMLIQVEWASGRLMREYTALLDPPGFGDQSSATTAALPAVDTSTYPGMPGTNTEPIPAKSKGRKGTSGMPEISGEMPAEDMGDGYTTRKGDTLHAIAMQNSIEGVSLEQMLIGLYRANQSAFVANNMNRLKVGQIIRVPSQDELQAVSRQDAVKEIRVHTADWNAYRNKLAGMVAESAPAAEEPTPRAAEGKITSTAEDKSVPPVAGPRDVVKLSKSETGTAKAEGADVAGRLTALQEEATAREKSLKESGERVASLEKQLQDMQKLLEIKNKSLADAQKSAVKPPDPAPMPPKVTDAPKQDAKPVEPSKPEVKPVEPPKAEPVPAPSAAEKPAPAKPEAKPQQKKPKKIVRPPAPAKEEPGMLDGLLGNTMLLAGVGGLLVLIGGVWFFLRNKRRKGLDSFEQGILTSGGLKPNTVFGNTAGGTVDTGNTSFLTDFGQGASAAMIDTNEVDPIAEAEVYMAYGRDAQAEEILKDALAKEPKRHELHLKLLEIYLGRKDVSAFETLAGELYASLGASDPTWAKVAELGRKLEPDNPLYGNAGVPQAMADEAPEPVDFDATMIQQPATAPAMDEVTDLGSSTLDFSLDEPAQEAVPEAAEAQEESALDFDIGALEMPGETAAAPAEPETLPDIGASMPELEMPPSLEAAAPVEEVAFDVPALDIGQPDDAGISLDMELPEPVADESAQLDVADIGMEALPEMTSLEPAGAEAGTDDAAEAALEMPVLDISLDIAEPVQDIAAETTPIDLGLELPSLEEPAAPSAAMEEVSLDLPEAAVAEEATSLAMEVTEEPAGAASGLDFNFDADLGELETPAETAAAAAPSPLADLDLSGISLDVEEATSPTDAGATEDITMTVSEESADVDTKLDLITAYIDMGDQDGARELLEEVLKEGGPTQREKAQKLLDGLG